MSKVHHSHHFLDVKHEPNKLTGLVTEIRFNEAIAELKQENLILKKDIDHRFDYLKKDMDHRFEMVDKKFEIVDKRFEAIDRKFDEMSEKIDTTAKATKDSLITSFELKISHNTNKLMIWNFGLIGSIFVVMAKGFHWF